MASKLSLEQMLDAIPPQSLDQKVNDTHLGEIARKLIDWKYVCTDLSINEAEEKTIEEENKEVDARRRAVLRKWRSKHGPTATYRNLAKCFYKADMLDMVEVVCQTLGSPKQQQEPLMASTSVEGAASSLFSPESAGGSSGSLLSHSGVGEAKKDSSVRMSVTNSSNRELPSALRREHSNTSTANSTNAELKNALSSHPPFQRLSSSEQEELEEMLDEDVREMTREFGYLVTKTCDSVEKRIAVGKFSASILALRAYEPAPEERDRSLLDEHREEIKRATTISEIFNILCPYWNYLNCELLEYIIKLYGTSEDAERLASYHEKLHRFCERRIFEVPMPGSGTSTGDSKQKKFSVKLNVREGTTCKELRQIKGRIAKILHVKMAVLIIVNVDPGCVQLTFLIPKFIAQEIFPLSHEQALALSKEASVIRLECGDYVLECTSVTRTEDQSTESLELKELEEPEDKSQLDNKQ